MFYYAPFHLIIFRIGTETLAAMSATVINATEASLKRFTPMERNCYVDDEFYFKNLLWIERFRYSIRNCFYEAVIAEIIKVNVKNNFTPSNFKQTKYSLTLNTNILKNSMLV